MAATAEQLEAAIKALTAQLAKIPTSMQQWLADQARVEALIKAKNRIEMSPVNIIKQMESAGTLPPSSMPWTNKSYTQWASAKRQTLLGNLSFHALSGPKSNRRKIGSGFKNMAIGNFRRGLAGLRTGGRGIAKKLGFGKAGQAVGGRLAMGAGWIGAAVTFTAALKTAIDALRSWSKGVIDEQFKLSSASPSMALIEQGTELREFFRTMRKGEARAESARETARLQQNAEDDSEDMDNAWNEIKMWGSRRISKTTSMFNNNKFGAAGGAIVGALGGPIGSIIGATIGAELEDYGRQGSDWLGKKAFGFDSEYYTRKENRPEIESDLKEAVEKGDKVTAEKLQAILDKMNELQPGEFDLNGWLLEAAEQGRRNSQEAADNIRRMQLGGGGRGDWSHSGSDF